MLLLLLLLLLLRERVANLGNCNTLPLPLLLPSGVPYVTAGRILLFRLLPPSPSFSLHLHLHLHLSAPASTSSTTHSHPIFSRFRCHSLKPPNSQAAVNRPVHPDSVESTTDTDTSYTQTHTDRVRVPATRCKYLTHPTLAQYHHQPPVHHPPHGTVPYLTDTAPNQTRPTRWSRSSPGQVQSGPFARSFSLSFNTLPPRGLETRCFDLISSPPSLFHSRTARNTDITVCHPHRPFSLSTSLSTRPNQFPTRHPNANEPGKRGRHPDRLLRIHQRHLCHNLATVIPRIPPAAISFSSDQFALPTLPPASATDHRLRSSTSVICCTTLSSPTRN